jgi:diguanylate cyclase (GGDEF)-like protein
VEREHLGLGLNRRAGQDDNYDHGSVAASAARTVHPVRRLAPPPGARVVLFAAALAVSALVLAAAGARPPALAGRPGVPWWIFAGLFAVTEACVVQLRLRREAFSLSLSEAPLVIGLFLASPGELLLGRVVGSALVFVAYRRQGLLKAGFNTALVAAGTMVATSAFATLLPPGTRDGPPVWASALAATAAAGVLDSVALMLVVAWYGSSVTLRGLLGEAGSSMAVSTVVGGAGLFAVTGLGAQARWPLVAAGALVLLGYRAFAALADRHTSLERLYRLSDALAAAPAWDDVVTSVLVQAGDLLRAGYVELLLTGHGAGRTPLGPQRWSLRAGGGVEGPHDATGLAGVGLALPPPGPALLRPGSRQEGAAAFLAARGLAEALVVPLRVDERAVGHLLVGDRTGAARFAPGDVRLLETVANHGAIALRNGRLIQRLGFEARHDELTGLPNRLSFRELLDVAAADAGRSPAPCTVMVLDFDGFKAVNDTLGHPAGDELLRVLAGRLERAAGTDALVARLGGDEFAVLSTLRIGPDAAVALAGRLLAVFDEPVAVAGTRLRLGGSLGISLGPDHGTSGADLLRNADIAMYAAKTSGGGARLFSPDLADTTAEALTLASDLRDAIEADDVGVGVQPIVDLTSGALHSVEVLARWRHGELGDVSAELLLEAADRSGQVLALSVRILERALGLARSWVDAGTPVRVAVNLAPRWLVDAGLPDYVTVALERHGVPAELLGLELREASVIADPRRALDTLQLLRGAGVHLAVDDFGTGYSSLTYLTRLPVDQLKIDASFVGRLGDSAQDRTIVRSIVDLGRTLGLDVVAQGVADEATRRALVELGCGLGQGPLFALPPGLSRPLAGVPGPRQSPSAAPVRPRVS